MGAVRCFFAIDPGPAESGYVLYGDNGKVFEWGTLPNSEMLARIARGPGGLPVIEMIASYGMPVGAEVFETCVWIGRFVQAYAAPGLVMRVPRMAVKMHLCHHNKAGDSNIWKALVDRFGPPGTKKKPGTLYGIRAHARAALALAVYAGDTLT